MNEFYKAHHISVYISFGWLFNIINNTAKIKIKKKYYGINEFTVDEVGSLYYILNLRIIENFLQELIIFGIFFFILVFTLWWKFYRVIFH